LSESGFTGFKDKKDYGLSWVAATPVASSGPAFETVIVNVVDGSNFGAFTLQKWHLALEMRLGEKCVLPFSID